MSSFSNTMGITQIEYSDSISCFCPLGKTNYTNNFTVIIEPDKIIPDYVEIHAEIQDMNGKTLTIEEAVLGVFARVNIGCRPKKLKVSSKVTDAVHPPVIVTKELK